MGEFTKSVFGSVNLSQQGYGWILDPAVAPAVSTLEARARCRCLRVCISPNLCPPRPACLHALLCLSRLFLVDPEPETRFLNLDGQSCSK